MERYLMDDYGSGSKSSLVLTPPLAETPGDGLKRTQSLPAWPGVHLTFSKRIERIGVTPLLALVAGGIILIFVSINALNSPKTLREGRVSDEEKQMKSRFRLGSDLTIQEWTAIIGVGFGLLSYGWSEAYFHLFDWWCSKQVDKPEGLDYGRYLNSDPNAPVGFGFLGFPLFASLRYCMLLMAIVGSVGYKFGVIQADLDLIEQLDKYSLRVNPFQISGVFNSDASPWLSDGYGGINRCFVHDAKVRDPAFAVDQTLDDLNIATDKQATTVPKNIVMTSDIRCSENEGTVRKPGEGYITTRELVLVANLTEDSDQGTMTRDEGDWHRTRSMSSRWLNNTDFFLDTSVKVVVDYRISKPGQVQIQWAKIGDWITDMDSNTSEPVVRRIQYNIHYEVAEVKRTVFLASCGYLDTVNAIRLLSNESIDNGNLLEDASLPSLVSWIDSLVSDQVSSTLDGVSGILRGIMAGWEYTNSTIHPIFEEGKFFESEDETRSERTSLYPFLDYPYFYGTRKNLATGLYIPAASIFLAIGILSLILAGIRIWAGPPALRSWTGQHVYLAQVGAVAFPEDREMLNTGYRAAPNDKWSLHHQSSKIPR